MKKLLLITSALLLGVSAVMAVPAKPGVKKMLSLKDGTRVEACLRGDEFVNYFEAVDGRTFQLKDNVYQQVDRTALAELHAVRATAANQRRAMRLPRRQLTPNHDDFRGTKRGLVILAQFSDVKFTFDQATFNDFFNKEGFDYNGMQGSVHDYFLEQSYGLFDLEFDVLGPVTMPKTLAYYAGSNGNKNVGMMVSQLCRELDDEVDFKKYDWDGDGTVDQVFVVFAGYSMAQGAMNTIWPHEWSLSDCGVGQYLTNEGVKVDTYAISSELMGDGVNFVGHLDGIGTSCHEFSHCLGLPDFYDTGHNDDSGEGAFGMSYWDLMDGGSYVDDGYCPIAYTAYERWISGWLEPIELSGSQQIVDMPPLVDEPVAYILYNDAERNEYYLLQNVQRKGFYSKAFGHGLMVLHVDYDQSVWRTNSVNKDKDHQRMYVIPADGVFSYQTLSGDLFPGPKNNTELTNTSTPAATLFNANVDGQKLMNKPITDIVEANGFITFNVMGGVSIDAPVATDATAISETGFTANWQAYPGAKQYDIRLTQIIASENPWDFLMLGENFENFKSDVSSSTDISDKLDEYTHKPGWDGQNLFQSPNKLRVGNAAKAGRLVTPVLEAPSQSALSIAFTPVNISPRSEGALELHVMLASDTTQYGRGVLSNVPKLNSEDAGKAWILGLESWIYGDFRIGIVPYGAGTYVQYLGIFDGYYTWEDFPNESEAPAFAKGLNVAGKTVHRLSPDDLTWNTPDGKAPKVPAASTVKRAKKETSTFFTTTSTSYTFTDLSPATYSYQVRVTTAEGVSPWSNQVTVGIGTGIAEIQNSNSATQNQFGTVFDLSGRRVTQPAKGLYIRNGRKYIVK